MELRYINRAIKKAFRVVSLLLIFFCGKYSTAQDGIDTLFSEMYGLQYAHPDSALLLLDSLEKNHSEDLTKKQEMRLENYRANIYWYINQLNTSLRYYKKALNKAIENQDTSNVVLLQADIGYVFSDQGKDDSAIYYLHKSIDLAEDYNLLEEKNRSQTFLAHSYENIGKFNKALEIYKSVAGFYLERSSRENVFTVYMSMAICYESLNQLDTARYYYEKILEDADEDIRVGVIGLVKQNLAGVYLKLQEYDKSKLLIAESKTIFSEIGNEAYLNLSVIIEGDIQAAMGNYQQSIQFYKMALADSSIGDDLKRQTIITKKLTESYARMNDFKNAYIFQTKLMQLQDSSTSIQNQDYVADMEAKYHGEKKEKEIALLNKDKQLKEAELDKKSAEVDRANFQKGLFGLGILVLIIVIVFVIKGLRQKQKANLLLTSQKIQIEEKNREIVDSINYAKRIQAAILPPLKSFDTLFKESFVLYEPKDIVAGDFYWLEEYNGKVYFAAADCTGHGVPGALVSVVCSNALSKALIEEGETVPANLLNRTRELVIEKFGKSEEEIKDGMDISLCAFDPVKRTIEWAGANNPLWVLRKEANEFEMYKADKQPIGKYGVEKPFTNHEISIHENDQIYIFTDGFQDQFGGEANLGKEGGKKYKPSRLKKYILSNKLKPHAVQMALLKEEFTKWRGDIEQVDDVCIIGIRF